MNKPKVSIVVIAYNMGRELPRTLLTLRAPYQKYIENSDIEIIVVDNGSKQPTVLDNDWTNVKYLNFPNPTHSPVEAVNYGLSKANASLIGVMIDGARMASPNLLNYAILASNISNNCVISTIAYHLGSEVQMESVPKGYNQQAENLLLDSVPWQDDGYCLFDISVFAGSSKPGWFNPIGESNAIFTSRELWHKLGGFDPKFKTAGGGLANLDVYLRAAELKDSLLVSLIGEGTFHQVHGGVATNPIDQQTIGKNSKIFRKEYQDIRGKEFKCTKKSALLFGKVRHKHKRFLLESMGKLAEG